MMREIITIQVGQCGNRVGQEFWQVVSDEHGINYEGLYHDVFPPQLKRISVYYNETQDGRFYPRAIFTDLEPGVLNSIQGDSHGQFFNTNNFISGALGAANNFAKGHYIGGPEIVDSVMEIVRAEVELCDSLQGFQLVHSLGGGTGSGFGTLMMFKIKEDYPDSILNNYSIIPSEKVSDVVVEPYNTVLALRHLTEYSDSTFCIDNEALFNICHQTLRINKPHFSNLNHLISITMSGITTCFRFPAELNTDLRKLAVNMVPYPRLHFYIPGFLPLTTNFKNVKPNTSVKELSRGILDPSNMLVASDPRQGKYLTVAAIFRGHMSVTEVEQEMNSVQEENKKYFVDWLSNNMKLSVCNIPSRRLFDSATFIVNATSIQEVFKRILTKFQTMQRRKAFVHWYLGEGMDEEEFKSAEKSLIDLISEYEQHASAE